MKKFYQENKAATIIFAICLLLLMAIGIVLIVRWRKKVQEEKLPLLHIDKVPANERVQFETGVRGMAARLQADPNQLMQIMDMESGLNPKATNPTTGATGIFQAMPDTANLQLGVSPAALRDMTATQQLPFFEKYLKPYASKMNTFKDTYLAVFYPAAMGKNSSFKLPSWVTPANAIYDLDKNGEITVGEIAKWMMDRVKSKVPQQYHKFFKS